MSDKKLMFCIACLVPGLLAGPIGCSSSAAFRKNIETPLWRAAQAPTCEDAERHLQQAIKNIHEAGLEDVDVYIIYPHGRTLSQPWVLQLQAAGDVLAALPPDAAAAQRQAALWQVRGMLAAATPPENIALYPNHATYCGWLLLSVAGFAAAAAVYLASLHDEAYLRREEAA